MKRASTQASFVLILVVTATSCVLEKPHSLKCECVTLNRSFVSQVKLLWRSGPASLHLQPTHGYA